MMQDGNWKAALVVAIVMAASSLAFGGFFEFGERPLGSEANRQASAYLAAEAQRMGYEVERLPFKCMRWDGRASFIERDDVRITVRPSPFSPGFDQWCEAVMVDSTQQLKRTRCDGKLVFLRGTIAKEPLMPRDFPFYFPDAHREIYALLDERKPAAIMAITGKHPASGLEPFPLIEDANFKIPSGYLDQASMDQIMSGKSKIRLMLDSRVFPETGEQVVATKKAVGESRGKIALFAHMDTAYGTPGALDNAAGVAVLLAAMEKLKNYAGPYDLEFIPFNGEDSSMVKGQLAYLEQHRKEMGDIRLGINLDAVGAKGSQAAVSTYNLDAERQAWLDEMMSGFERIERGPEWVEGDHSIFVFQGVPCLAVTSSNLREGVMAVSHTPADTLDGVERELLVETADFIAELVNGF